VLDFLFLTGQVVSALLLLYGGYLALFHLIVTSLAPDFFLTAPMRSRSVEGHS